MEKTLQEARLFFPEFQLAKVSITVLGDQVDFQFYWRDPWEWMQTLVCDPTLAEEIRWYPCRKFYHDGKRKIRVYDDVDTGDLWWRVQVSQYAEKTPHCYLPLHYWSDKGKVSSRVKKHPLVFRPCFLPRAIRNGSGNGGGVIIALLPIFDPLTTADRDDRKSAEGSKLALKIRAMQHAALRVIFEPLRGPSKHGAAIECGDKKVRILHPGVAIASMDYEQAAMESLNRGVQANHPCGACHVESTEQHAFTQEYSRKTVPEMKAAFDRASAATTNKAQAEILMKFGTYLIKNAFWCLAHSDIYLALCYDILHSDDLGKMKKIFKLLKGHLNASGLGGTLNEIFSTIPPYPGLKHFGSVTTIEYTDGNTMFHIMKCLVFAIANLLPPSSAPWVQLIRAYSRLRIVLGFTVMTEDRLKKAEHLRDAYASSAKAVSDLTNWSQDFPKAHALSHALQDIKEKGATINYTTRYGEAMIQEIKAYYFQTNGKDADKYMSILDQNHEVLTQMMNWYQQWTKARETVESDAEDGDPDAASESSTSPADTSVSTDHHDLGSPSGKTMSFEAHQDSWSQDAALSKIFIFGCFDKVLINDIQITLWKTIYVNYTSLEDWLPQRCIVRCNPSFHSKERFDTVIIDDVDGLRYASLRLVFSWQYAPDKKPISIALVRFFDAVSWKPKNKFDGMQIFKSRADTHVIYIASIIRSCHMIPVYGKDNHFFLNDQLDADMFLRVGGVCE
ncbi:hypothetical protein SISSUDRAFT_1010687 [Sistotremastrum suecicum HHB10207 ss-3]|uniref:Uncharacterized protein n=1 Tax=Sistotremastrum suecicum HHB10207 ss-3 TaxID=1314776 RepID=A0A165YZ86_9AGAM|nr:hypothetical protein SISSUDRAFT_1010687 [Sistotremastrum suecicum HHB10207 ss-3]